MEIQSPQGAEVNSFVAVDPGSELRRKLIEAISTGKLKPGERLVSLRDLANQYGASFSVARSVVESLEREGMVEMRRGSGTFVTQRKATQPAVYVTTAATSAPRQYTVGLQLGLNEHVYGQITHALVGILNEHDVQPVILPTFESFNVDRYRQRLTQAGVSELSAIVTQASVEMDSILPRSVRRIALKLSGPSLLMPAGWHSVSVDVQSVGRIAVEHLLEHGHRRIGLITHARAIHPLQPWNLRKRTTGHTRLITALGQPLHERGLHSALSIHYGLKYDESNPLAVGEGAPESEANLHAIEAWLSQPNRPTAVVGDDRRLYAVKIAATRLGLSVPRDLELLGLGNTPYSQACGFSSLSYNEPEIAKQIAELLLAEDAQLASTDRHILVRPSLIVRG